MGVNRGPRGSRNIDQSDYSIQLYLPIRVVVVVKVRFSVMARVRVSLGLV